MDVNHAIVYPQNAQKLPSMAHHLLIVRDVLSNEVKLFLASAPESTTVETGGQLLDSCKTTLPLLQPLISILVGSLVFFYCPFALLES